jgi:hypothetical protein
MMRVCRLLLGCALVIGDPVIAASLSTDGVDLGRVSAASVKDGLNVTVELGDDMPAATHIIARHQNNQPLMRGADGFWAPWDGEPGTLEDVAAIVSDRKLTFHIFDRLPEDLFYPAIFTLTYRTAADGLKSGTIVVDGP